MSQPLIDLQHISKRFDDTLVLDDLSLSVKENSFVTLLGPSGCGKTTTLRIIGGFESPNTGKVIFGGEDITKLPPNKRQLNTVFQKYALFPHMSIADNIAFGLKIKNKSKAYIDDKIKYALKLVNLNGFEHRSIDSLSGGQQQRIAIARAIVNEPKVLLLDEPLGALDLKLRQDMQYELIRLKNELGITFIYITHDQEEAINMSDTIVVMRDGRFEQIGSPSEVYDHPKTSYVASFVGSANVLKGTVEKISGDTVVLRNSSGTMVCDKEHFSVSEGSTETLAVRSEQISVWREPKSACSLTGSIVEKTFVGGMLRIVVKLHDGDEVVVSRHGINFDYDIGDQVYLEWEPEQAVFVDMEA